MQYRETVCSLMGVIIQSHELCSGVTPTASYEADKAMIALLEVLALHIGALPEVQQSEVLANISSILPDMVRELKKENFPKSSWAKQSH